MDILIAVFMYATFLIGTGLYFYKKTHSASDYLFSNRSLNYWVTAISAQASDMSSWLFLALPGAIYQRGLFEAWFVLGLIVFMYLNWHFVAPKLRLATANLSSITLPSYFAHQLKDKTGRLQIVSTIVSLFFFLMYIASGLVALGRLFQVFGIPYRLGMSAGIAVSLIYTLFGGLSAVAWSDLFQGLFLLIINHSCNEIKKKIMINKLNKKEPFIIKKILIGIKITELKILLTNSLLIKFFQNFFL